MSHDAFEKAIEVVLEHEGGLVDHSEDPGGITNFGISLRWAVRQHVEKGDSALMLLDVDGDGDVDADDIRKMGRTAAKNAYLKYFWQPGKYGNLVSDLVAIKIFDMAVNMGSRQAHRLAQRAVRSANGIKIADDGVLGRISFDQINHADPAVYLAALRSEHAGFYRALIIRNDAVRKLGIDVPDFNAFKEGWLRRAYA